MKIRQVKEIDVDISERIRQARIDVSNRKSLAAICDEVGVSTTYWYDIEKNKIRGALSIENLRKIEKALGIDLGVTL
jgi:transcriptional regulator with XRE-family HTH domain